MLSSYSFEGGEGEISNVIAAQIAALQGRLNACNTVFRVSSQQAKVSARERLDKLCLIGADIVKLEGSIGDFRAEMNGLSVLVDRSVRERLVDEDYGASACLDEIEASFIENSEHVLSIIGEIASEVEGLGTNRSNDRIDMMFTSLQELQAQQESLSDRFMNGRNANTAD